MAKRRCEVSADEFYEGMPIIETWHSCRQFDDGWRGVRPNGQEVLMRHDDPNQVARIPEGLRLLVPTAIYNGVLSQITPPLEGYTTVGPGYGLIMLKCAAP
jgi:hypothetical protein